MVVWDLTQPVNMRAHMEIVEIFTQFKENNDSVFTNVTFVLNVKWDIF